MQRDSTRLLNVWDLLGLFVVVVVVVDVIGDTCAGPADPLSSSAVSLTTIWNLVDASSPPSPPTVLSTLDGDSVSNWATITAPLVIAIRETHNRARNTVHVSSLLPLDMINMSALILALVSLANFTLYDLTHRHSSWQVLLLLYLSGTIKSWACHHSPHSTWHNNSNRDSIKFHKKVTWTGGAAQNEWWWWHLTVIVVGTTCGDIIFRGTPLLLSVPERNVKRERERCEETWVKHLWINWTSGGGCNCRLITVYATPTSSLGWGAGDPIGLYWLDLVTNEEVRDPSNIICGIDWWMGYMRMLLKWHSAY